MLLYMIHMMFQFECEFGHVRTPHFADHLRPRGPRHQNFVPPRPMCYQHFCEKIVEATGGPIDFPAAWVAGDVADTKLAALQDMEERYRIEEPELERSPER
ncbi:unnamed protein product [Durusdinium trenchii]|uniref:Uncharacterized protein n=2 Tax=Durusdinium trenchii TaxID=1381693 RepID=A0ABP0I4F7_9DINO